MLISQSIGFFFKYSHRLFSLKKSMVTCIILWLRVAKQYKFWSKPVEPKYKKNFDHATPPPKDKLTRSPTEVSLSFSFVWQHVALSLTAFLGNHLFLLISVGDQRSNRGTYKIINNWFFDSKTILCERSKISFDKKNTRRCISSFISISFQCTRTTN